MNEYVTCPICNKNVKQLTNSHLKTHNLTTVEFKQLYPNISLVSEKLKMLNTIHFKLGSINNNVAKLKHISHKTQYLLNPKNCINCNAIIPYNKRVNIFCSHSCSASYNNVGTVKSVESKLKLSNYAKLNPKGFVLNYKLGLPHTGYIKPKLPRTISICPVCTTEFEHRLDQKRQYCSNTCYLNSGNAGGFKQNSTKVHRSIYNNQQMDSGAELVFAKLLDYHKILWVKNTTIFFEYSYNNKNGKYYPDFYLPDINLWVEIKGKKYIREGDTERLQSVPNIILIMASELRNTELVISKIYNADIFTS